MARSVLNNVSRETIEAYESVLTYGRRAFAQKQATCERRFAIPRMFHVKQLTLMKVCLHMGEGVCAKKQATCERRFAIL